MRKNFHLLIQYVLSITIIFGLASPLGGGFPARAAQPAQQAPLATYTVTTTADSGPSSLRQAILDANANPGADTIAFAIGAPGSQQTIQPLSALPVLTDAVTVDGWSQGGAGYAGPPLVELNGALAGSNAAGLSITAGSSTVRGLVINGFTGTLASGIRLQTGGDNWMYGNYIGTDFAGDTRLANQRGIWIDGGSSNNRIGTDADGVNDTAERNVISANIDQNIWIYQPATTGNKIMGNYIGLNASGAAAVGTNNQTVAAAGILVQEASTTIIGTDGDGIGDALEGNVISGSILNINLTGTTDLNESHHNRISGNLIGTDASGTTSVGIQVEGVRVYVGYDNLIGTDGDGISDALEGNVISGHFDWGVMLQQTGSLNTVVAGNKIGTDITGMLSIPNGYGGSPRAGIHLGGYGNRIGTDSDGLSDALERNLISGNSQTTISAIYFNNLPNPDAPPTIIAGNWMGVDATGLAALPNNYGIGGTSYAPTIIQNNVIAASTIEGISTHSSNMLITGNYIGVGADGVTPLGNGQHGIYLSGNDNLIGGTGPGEANIIAHNGTLSAFYSGVRVGNTGVGNAIRGNRIYANSQLGIDLRWPDGVNINDDGDPDTGGNNLQNYPLLSAASALGANVVVTGTLNSNSNTTFTLDFYSSEVCDASGHGEGEVYLGAGQVTTDASGDASFSIAVAGYAGNGDAVTATATHADGSTSEFSACVLVVGEEPISGLQASNDSPTSLGFATHLTATLATGTGVSFSWDFGDGSGGAGAAPAHVYPAVGSYTAIVTATNSLGSASASTEVSITAAPQCTATPDDGVTVFGSANNSAVQQAVTAATSGGTVKVAGTCAGVNLFGSWVQSVYVNKPLTLAGGYSVTDWSTPDPQNYPTLLDAQGLGRVVFVPSALALTIENMTLQNGFAASTGGNCPAAGCGGGVYTPGDLTLRGVELLGNSGIRGGGAYVAGALDAQDTSWQDNTATNQRGGALEVYGEAGLTGGLLQGNTGLYGGGVFADAGLVISGTQFIDNTASSPTSGSGGAVYAAGPLEISHALFEGNQSYTGAGAVLHSPGAGGLLSIINTQFRDNSTLNASAQGGALYAGADSSTIQSSHFEGNTAPGSSGAGGAIVAFKELTLIETELISNTTGGQGGAIYHWGLSESGNTSQVYPLAIDNSRLAGNQAGGQGGGLYFRRGFAASNTPVQLTQAQFENNIAVLEGGGVYLGQPGDISGSLLQNNQSATAAGGGLYSEDRLSLLQTSFQDNTGTRGGGAYVLGALTAVDSDWLDNTATGQRGGGLEVYAEAGLTGGLLQGNTGLYGGGVFADAGLVISGTQFIGNTATSTSSGSGGAVYAAGPLEISHALFEGNQSYTGAGAVLHSPGVGELLSIINTQFRDNSTLNASAQGGALYAGGDSSTIQSSHFEGNTAPGSSGAGGALVAFKDIVLTDTVLISNTAGGQGGAIYHWGLSETGQTDLITTLTLTDTRLVSNTAGGEGGGLYFRQGFAASNVPVQVSGSTFDGNTASLDGGGAYLGQPVELTSSLFLGNASLNASGGGLALDGGSASAHSIVTNAVFAGNAANSSAGIYASGSGQVDVLHTTLADSSLSPVEAISVDGPNVFLVNTIVVSHTVGIELTAGAVSADKTLFYGNLADTQGAVDNQAPVSGAPNFLDAPAGDYHLALGSAAIDAASEAGILEDLDGDIRPIIGYSDIGADEFGDSTLVDPAASTTISTTISPVQAIIIRIPPGAILDPRIFRLLPVQKPSVPPPSPRRPAGMFFIFQPDPPAATALQQALFETPFVLPVELTLEYSDADLAGIAEDSLFLAVLDETSGEWLDATTTCPSPGAVLRQPEENRITVTSCASGEFALLGSPPGGALYLPLIQR